jgi:hypothetical protein
VGARVDLPKHVADLIQTTFSVEFATVSTAGVPIDTPTLSFPKEDLSTIDVATGLAYPVKAERLRRNPKAGLWIDGVLPGEPTISIAGMGATKDADIQANSLRYIEEIASYGVGLMAPWSLEHKAVWYWSRIVMWIAPREILWWDSAADLDKEPHRWEAPAGTIWPTSDPAPAGPPTKAPKWPQPHWTELAKNALGRNEIGHVCLIDANGFPRPGKARNIEQTADGFVMDLPRYAPGNRNGPASLSFKGFENFVGTASEEAGRIRLKVDHALPLLPFVTDPQEQWTPKPVTYEAMMGRLKAELARRNQPMPVIPSVKPAPTRGGKRRAERFERIVAQMQLPKD